MKMKDVQINQIVIQTETDRTSKNIPYVGVVVGITYEYDITTMMKCNLDRPVRVLPLVKFLLESAPRAIAPANIEIYKGNE
jgi:hypothetical protein